MTIDEMEQVLGRWANEYMITGCYGKASIAEVGRAYKAIIAALKAGQEMRDKFTVIYDARDDFHVATKVDFIGLGESGKSWDAITKENV
jgi:hypothetical protein